MLAQHLIELDDKLIWCLAGRVGEQCPLVVREPTQVGRIVGIKSVYLLRDPAEAWAGNHVSGELMACQGVVDHVYLGLKHRPGIVLHHDRSWGLAFGSDVCTGI